MAAMALRRAILLLRAVAFVWVTVRCPALALPSTLVPLSLLALLSAFVLPPALVGGLAVGMPMATLALVVVVAFLAALAFVVVPLVLLAPPSLALVLATAPAGAAPPLPVAVRVGSDRIRIAAHVAHAPGHLLDVAQEHEVPAAGQRDGLLDPAQHREQTLLRGQQSDLGAHRDGQLKDAQHPPPREVADLDRGLLDGAALWTSPPRALGLIVGWMLGESVWLFMLAVVVSMRRVAKKGMVMISSP